LGTLFFSKTTISDAMFHYKTALYRSRSLSEDSCSTMGLADEVSVSSVSTTNSTAAKRSQARAQRLQALYELSSERDLSLNKVANLRTNPTTCAPTLNTVSAKDATAAFQARRWLDQQRHETTIDAVVLKENDRKELMAERKVYFSAQDSSQGHLSGLTQDTYGIISHRGSQNIHHPAVAPGLQRFVPKYNSCSDHCSKQHYG
jgi:hypothetical protein